MLLLDPVVAVVIVAVVPVEEKPVETEKAVTANLLEETKLLVAQEDLVYQVPH